MMSDTRLSELVQEATNLRYSRRQILQRGAALGLSTQVVGLALAATGHAAPAASAYQDTAEVKPRGGDKVEFSYLRPTWGPATYTKGGAYETLLEELGNAEIEVQIVPVIDYDTKVNTVLASGDIPDVIWGSGPSVGIWRDGEEQGAFLPINEYLDKYPDVKAAVPDSIWERLRDENGDIYFIPHLIWPVVPFFLFYRQDLLEQADLAEPKTVDEFVTLLEALKTQFPEMAAFSMGYEWHAKDLATAYEFSEFGWEPVPDDPDQIIPWYTQDKEIEFRFWLQDLHRRALLDPNYGVNREPNFSTDNFKAGKVVIATENWLAFPDIVTNLLQVEPNAKVGVLSPLGPSAGTRTVFPVDRGFYVSARIADPDGFFDFLNWTLTEGSDFRRYGVEGKTYNILNRTKVPIPDVNREQDFRGPQIEPLRFLDPFSEKLDWDQMQLNFESAGVGDQFEYIRGKYEEYDKNEYPDYRNPFVISPTEAEDGPRLYEDYLRSTTESVIINHDLTREDWMAAVEKWKDAGGAQIIEEVNELQEDKSKPDYKV